MLNVLNTLTTPLSRDLRVPLGGGMLVLVIHLIVMGSVFRDMAQSGAVI